MERQLTIENGGKGITIESENSDHTKETYRHRNVTTITEIKPHGDLECPSLKKGT